MTLEVVVREPQSRPRPVPLLFIHPIGHTASYWDEHFLPYFAHHGYHCYAMNLRGHGASPGRERLRWASVADYVADVAEVVSQLPQAPILVGDSLGGMLVRKYLESRHVPAAVLMSPASRRGAVAFSLRLARRHPLVFLKLNLTLSVYPLLSTPALYREVFCSATLPDEQVRRYQARAQDDSYRMYADLLMGRAEPRPRQPPPPVLVLAGDQDTTFPSSAYAAIARAYQTQPVVLPGLPHAMALDARWQVAADRILEWLEQQPLA
jgi:pimeloyl-ACP methyl ester carboxylesterase